MLWMLQFCVHFWGTKPVFWSYNLGRGGKGEDGGGAEDPWTKQSHLLIKWAADWQAVEQISAEIKVRVLYNNFTFMLFFSPFCDLWEKKGDLLHRVKRKKSCCWWFFCWWKSSKRWGAPIQNKKRHARFLANFPTRIFYAIVSSRNNLFWESRLLILENCGGCLEGNEQVVVEAKGTKR